MLPPWQDGLPTLRDGSLQRQWGDGSYRWEHLHFGVAGC